MMDEVSQVPVNPLAGDSVRCTSVPEMYRLFGASGGGETLTVALVVATIGPVTGLPLTVSWKLCLGPPLMLAPLFSSWIETATGRLTTVGSYSVTLLLNPYPRIPMASSL